MVISRRQKVKLDWHSAFILVLEEILEIFSKVWVRFWLPVATAREAPGDWREHGLLSHFENQAHSHLYVKGEVAVKEPIPCKIQFPYWQFCSFTFKLLQHLKGSKATNERQGDGTGVLLQVAQFPIDQVYLYTRRPCPSPPTQDPESIQVKLSGYAKIKIHLPACISKH